MPRRKRTTRYDPPDDPIVQAGRLKDDEVSRLLDALSMGMGYADHDELSSEQQRHYAEIGQMLLQWATQMRTASVLVEMAIRGEVIVRFNENSSNQGWEFHKTVGKVN